jgi:hypothetical protein
MPRTLLFLGFLLGLVLAVMGCGKDSTLTTIIGRVVDNDTGNPIADAYIDYNYSENIDGKPFYTNKQVKTDSDGGFGFTFPSVGVGMIISRDGYLSKDLGKDIGRVRKLTVGTTNDIGDQRLYPRDGFFKLILVNSTDTYSKIYGHFVSNQIERETPGVGIDISKGLSKGETSSQVWEINSNDWVKIYWGAKYFGSPQFAPHADSFYVSKIDTAVYQIDF